MSLDFSALNNIPSQGAKNGFSEPPERISGNLAMKTEKPDTGQNRSHSEDAGGGALCRLEAEREARELLRKEYARLQENTLRSERIRGEILKGITRKEEPLALLLKAIECISLMTGDTAMLAQSQRDLASVYGLNTE